MRKAEYDRIFKIIPSCARFRENCENICLVVKLPLFVSLLPRNVDVVLWIHLWRYVITRFPANIERSSLKTSMHLYCDVTSLCKFGALKSYLLLALSRVPLRNECLFSAFMGKWTWVRHVTNPVNHEAVLGRFVTASPKFISHERRKIRRSFLIFTISSNKKLYFKRTSTTFEILS